MHEVRRGRGAVLLDEGGMGTSACWAPGVRPRGHGTRCGRGERYCGLGCELRWGWWSSRGLCELPGSWGMASHSGSSGCRGEPPFLPFDRGCLGGAWWAGPSCAGLARSLQRADPRAPYHGVLIGGTNGRGRVSARCPLQAGLGDRGGGRRVGPRVGKPAFRGSWALI